MRTKSLGLIAMMLVILTVIPAISVAAGPVRTVQAQRSVSNQPDPAIPVAPSGETAAPTASVNLNAANGYGGQPITVSGAADPGHNGVRVAWQYGQTMLTAAEVPVNQGNQYAATVYVPYDAAPGVVQICATVVGQQDAIFTCQDFTVLNAPAGSIAAAVPQGVSVGNGATVRIVDRAGQTIASSPLSPQGEAELTNIKPGVYTAIYDGPLSKFLAPSQITVQPGKKAVADAPLAPGIADTLCGKNALVALVSASPSLRNYEELVEVDPRIYSTMARFPPWATTMPDPFDFGQYVTGVPLNVRFQASTQRFPFNTTIERVDYFIKTGTASPVKIGQASTPPWQITYNVGQLTPGDHTLSTQAVVNGVTQCPQRRTIRVVADPMKDINIQPGTGKIVWDNQNGVYRFEGLIPDAAGILPAQFDTGNLPMVGNLENRLSAGFRVQGALYLDGRVWLEVLTQELYARILSIDVVNNKKNVTPPGFETQLVAENEIRNVAVPIPRFKPVPPFGYSVPVFASPLVVTGWVNVRMAVTVGVGGELAVYGWVYPLRPSLDFTIEPSVYGKIGIEVAVDILFGIAGASGSANPTVQMAFPLRINPEDTAQGPVWFDDPCMSFYIRMKLEGRILFFTFTAWEGDLLREDVPPNCSGSRYRQIIEQGIVAERGRVMPAPAIAAAPDGRMLSVYVEDTSPGEAYASPRIMARFKNPGAQDWGPAIPLSDATRAATDPAVAFAGPSGTPIAVWTQNTLSRAQAEAVGDDLNAVLRQQELYCSEYTAAGWSTPVRLTNDAVGDGRASLAGDSAGLTLAWTRDTDGDITTRDDQRIAVRQNELAGGTCDFGATTLLNGSTLAGSDGLNAQVSAARFALPAVQRRALAWTYDADADLSTNGDRRLAVALWDEGSSAWIVRNPNGLPVGVDSPTVVVSPDNPDLTTVAFLARGKDSDNSTDTGIVGDQGQLWTARLGGIEAAVLDASPMTDHEGGGVRAEAPRLSAAGDGEVLLAFRQFGSVTNYDYLGHTAISQAVDSGSFSAPLQLTSGPTHNWQTALAVNPVNNTASILRVVTSPDATYTAAQPEIDQAQATPSLARASLSKTVEPVAELRLADVADIALDPMLAVSALHANPSASVTITPTVRNLGRATADGVRVDLYRGPGSGTLVDTKPVPSLAFNEEFNVTFEVTAIAGSDPIYAVVRCDGCQDADAANNTAATLDLGGIPAPEALAVRESGRYLNALEVTWLPPAVPGVAGYRILRATAENGPYEVVGESALAAYSDLTPKRGTTYFYVMEAFDHSGTISDDSLPISGMLPLLTSFAPYVSR